MPFQTVQSAEIVGTVSSFLGEQMRHIYHCVLQCGHGMNVTTVKPPLRLNCVGCEDDAADPCLPMPWPRAPVMRLTA